VAKFVQIGNQAINLDLVEIVMKYDDRVHIRFADSPNLFPLTGDEAAALWAIVTGEEPRADEPPPPTPDKWQPQVRGLPTQPPRQVHPASGETRTDPGSPQQFDPGSPPR
jgi:hypothetical protein